MGNFELTKMINSAFDEALKKRGIVNVLIAGKTGVGKSTLINAVFQGNFASTGQGKPVSKDTIQIKKQGIPLSIYDTRGLEMEDYQSTFGALKNLIKERNINENSNEHIHVAWICISESSSRIEDGEIALLKLLKDNNIPTIGVITKAFSDAGFSKVVRRLMPDLVNVCRVNSCSITTDDGIKIESKGLHELIDVTMEVVPEGKKNAFTAAQRISINQKVKRARYILATSATASAGIGASPIPFSDATLLIPVQVGMLAGISLTFGIELEKAFLFTLISSTLTGAGATFAGRTIMTNLLKFIPGAGTVIGGVIGGSTAAAMTTAFGEAYINVLRHLLESKDISQVTSDDILKGFKEKMSLSKVL